MKHNYKPIRHQIKEVLNKSKWQDDIDAELDGFVDCENPKHIKDYEFDKKEFSDFLSSISYKTPEDYTYNLLKKYLS